MKEFWKKLLCLNGLKRDNLIYKIYFGSNYINDIDFFFNEILNVRKVHTVEFILLEGFNITKLCSIIIH